MSIKRTTKQFIRDSQKIHGNKYNYSKAIYKGINSTVVIKCRECGYVFTIKARAHLDNKRGCPICSETAPKNMNTEIFLKRLFIKIPNIKYTFGEFIYSGNQKKSVVTCEDHGNFLITPNDLLFGYGCKKCSYKRSGRKKDDINKVILKIKKIHGNRIKLIKETYVSTGEKAVFMCSACGKEFSSRASSISGGIGCPSCKKSHGETEIQNILIKHKISYEREKKITNCKYKKDLRFDFYLPDYNLLIEYDGEQHFREVKNWNNQDFAARQKRDEIKNKFCEENGYNLLRIPYYCKDELQEIVESALIA